MKMIVELEWNDELGPRWMNPDNLRLLLYGTMSTRPELLEVVNDVIYVDEDGECESVDDYKVYVEPEDLF